MVEFAWHVHHTILFESLEGSLEQRIQYIKQHKPKDEIALRLRLLKVSPKLKPLDEDYEAKFKLLDEDYWAKLKPLDEDYRAKRKLLEEDYWAKRKLLDEDYRAKLKPLDEDYRAKVEALHRIECPGCPWNGKTIFP